MSSKSPTGKIIAIIAAVLMIGFISIVVLTLAVFGVKKIAGKLSNDNKVASQETPGKTSKEGGNLEKEEKKEEPKEEPEEEAEPQPAPKPAPKPQPKRKNPADYGPEYFIIPKSSTAYITEADVDWMRNDPIMLRRAINEIYARHGLTFQYQENIDYFNSQPWYQADPNITDGSQISLNQYEQANVDYLVSFEKGIIDTPPTQRQSQFNNYAEDYIIPGSDVRYITADEEAYLRNAGPDTVRTAVNEIYARHGLTFKTQKFINYFNSKPWYQANPNITDGSQVEGWFYDYERTNLRILLDIENGY